MTASVPTIRFIPSFVLRFGLLLSGSAIPVHALTLLTKENPPFNYTENGRSTGLVTEVAQETMKRADGLPARLAAAYEKKFVQ